MQSSYRLPVLITEKSSETCSSLIMRKQNHYPGGSDSKESAYNVWDPGSIPELGRSPGEGNGRSLQYSCLENPTDRGAWRATDHGVTKESDYDWVTNTHTKSFIEEMMQASHSFPFVNKAKGDRENTEKRLMWPTANPELRVLWRPPEGLRHWCHQPSTTANTQDGQVHAPASE